MKEGRIFENTPYLFNYFLMLLKRLLVLVIIMFASLASFSQKDITGIWEGKFLSAELDLGQPRLVVEIYDFKDSMFKGITHLYYKQNKYEHYKMVGWYSKKDSLLVFKEVSTIAVDLGIYGNCLGVYMTKLSREGNKLLQFGYWEPNQRLCTTNSNVWLQKWIDDPKPEKRPAVPKRPVVKKPVVPVKPPKEKVPIPVIPKRPEAPPIKDVPIIRRTPTILPPKVAQRETDVQSLLEIDMAEKDSIRVDVYDNGEIDGDSVSVYEGGTVRIYKRMITAKPITFYVSLSKNVNPISHLRLVAESLGSIPPCTALMIVTTKKKRYEVRLSSNFSKNATVELFLKE